MSTPNDDKTVCTTIAELNELVLKAIDLAMKGFKVAGLSEIDGELSVFVEDVEDTTDLLIKANT